MASGDFTIKPLVLPIPFLWIKNIKSKLLDQWGQIWGTAVYNWSMDYNWAMDHNWAGNSEYYWLIVHPIKLTSQKVLYAGMYVEYWIWQGAI